MRWLILSDRSQYEVDREFAAISTGDGRSGATNLHVVLSDSLGDSSVIRVAVTASSREVEGSEMTVTDSNQESIVVEFSLLDRGAASG